MENARLLLQPFVLPLAGLLVGIASAWLILRLKGRDSLGRALAELDLERAAMGERLSARDQQVLELRGSLEKALQELAGLRREYGLECERRAAAEVKSSRVPEIEESVRAAVDQMNRLRQENTMLRTRLSEAETLLSQERKAAEEKMALLSDAQIRLSDAFKALSAEALKSNNRSFLELAGATLERFQQSARTDLEIRRRAIDELVKPLKLSLDKVDGKIGEMELARATAYVGITEQMKSLAQTQTQLQRETSSLVRALRAPVVRGRWGEIQLKRVVEIAGMIEYCDFVQQETSSSHDSRLRPDMIIRLPNGRNVVVDSKAPLQAYLSAMESEDSPTRGDRLKDHARHIRTHLSQLSGKAYWDQFKPAPEFAVLFLPGESFFSAALEQDPELIEFGVERNVILATPTTLIALLRAVAYGWRQERMAENALAISELGVTVYERVRAFVGHFADIRKGLERTVDAYNRSVGSMEGRVLVAVRKFKDLGASTGDDIETLEVIDKVARKMPDDKHCP